MSSHIILFFTLQLRFKDIVVGRVNRSFKDSRKETLTLTDYRICIPEIGLSACDRIMPSYRCNGTFGFKRV